MLKTRFLNYIHAAWRPALKNALWLLKIIVPITFIVAILQYLGVIQWVSLLLEPALKLIGLPGEAALIIVTSCLLNLYSAIAVMSSIPFTIKEATILALMCLIAHNLIVETTVQKRTGSSPIRMVIIRIISAVVAGYVMFLIFPENNNAFQKNILIPTEISFYDVVLNWLKSTFILSVKIVIIVVGLNIIQKLLNEFGVMKILSKIFAPVMVIFGLPKNTAFTWIVANVIGLAYGAGAMIEQFQQKKITQQENNILNYHIAVSHSLLEDTLLFVAIGLSYGWLVAPRLILAIIIVWLYRLICTLNEKKVLIPIINQSNNNNLQK